MILGFISIVSGGTVILYALTLITNYVTQQTVAALYMLIGCVLIAGGFICIQVDQLGKKIIETLEKKNEVQEKKPSEEKIEVEEKKAEKTSSINIENLKDYLSAEDYKKLSEEDQDKYRIKIVDLMEKETDEAKRKGFYKLLVSYGYLYYARFLNDN